MDTLTAAEERSLSEKLKLMTNFDSDQQFIAACDLSDFVEKHSQRIPETIQARIIDALLDHLKSEIIDVHGKHLGYAGNAIKCLSKVISKLPVQQSKRISEIMVKNVAAPTANSDLRDVYGTCVKTIINDVPIGFGDHIRELLKLTVDVLIERKHGNLKIEEELVDIAGSFMKKWPRMISRIDVKKSKFAEYLFENVVRRDDSVLRKRSIMCAGILAASLSRQELHDILYANGVVSYLSGERKADRQGLERRRYALQMLCSVLKSQNPAVQEDAVKLRNFLVEEALWLKKGGEDAKIDKADEMLECVLQALQYLFRSIKKQCAAGLVDGELSNLGLELTQYSPHAILEYVSASMEEQEDEYQDDNTDDYSERVRRAALQLLVVLANLSQPLCNQIGGSQEMYLPLCEKNEAVVQTSFAVLVELLSIVAYTEVSPATLSTVLENILKQLSTLFLSEHNYDGKIYSGAAHLICEVAKRLPGKLSADADLLKRYIELAGSSLHKAKSNQAKISLLNFIEVVGGEHAFLNYRPVLAVLLSMTDHPFYKVSLASLRAIYALIEKSHASLNKDDPEFRKFVEMLQVRAKKTDADQQIKHVATACVASLLAHCIDKLYQPEIEEFVKLLLSKISAEVEKRHILSAICRISTKLQITPVLTDALNGIVKVVANSCLPMADESIKSKAAEALDKCLVLLGNRLTEENALAVFNNSKSILTEGTLASYFEQLCCLYPDLVYPSVAKLIVMRVPPSAAIKALYDCKSANKQELVRSIVAGLRNDNLQTIIRLLADLGVNVSELVKQIGSGTELLVALQVGLKGSHGDPNNFKQFIQLVLADDQADLIKYQAAIGLGLILRAHPQLLSDLLELEGKQKYMMLVAVREYIRGCNALNEVLLSLLPRLFRDCGYENESVLNIISECVGLIASLDLTKTAEHVLGESRSEQANKRFVFANSCRYLFTREGVKLNGLEGYIQALVGMVRDPDLQVKGAVMKSLNSVAYHEPSALKPYANDSKFLEGLAESLLFDPNAVEEVNIGSVTEKIDRGKPLRLDTFSLLDTLFKKILVLDENALRLILASSLRTYDIDISIEVQIRRLLMVQSILEAQPSLLKEFSNDVVAVLSLNNPQWKQFKEKKPSEAENAEKLLLEMIKVVRLLRQAKDELPNGEAIQVMLQGLSKVPRFQAVMETLDNA